MRASSGTLESQWDFVRKELQLLAEVSRAMCVLFWKRLTGLVLFWGRGTEAARRKVEKFGKNK